jgi:hypothetical protein
MTSILKLSETRGRRIKSRNHTLRKHPCSRFNHRGFNKDSLDEIAHKLQGPILHPDHLPHYAFQTTRLGANP